MTKNADSMDPIVWRLQGDRWKLYDFFSSVAAGFDGGVAGAAGLGADAGLAAGVACAAGLGACGAVCAVPWACPACCGFACC